MADLPAHVAGSITSLSAAVDAMGGAESQRRRVFEAIHSSTVGHTDEEVQTMLDMNPSTQRPRRVELVRAGLVHDSGKTRATKSGRQATVWVAR